MLTEIYLYHTCSYHEIEGGNGAPGALVLADALLENHVLRQVVVDKNPVARAGGRALLRAMKGAEWFDITRTLQCRECNFDAEKTWPGVEKRAGSGAGAGGAPRKAAAGGLGGSGRRRSFDTDSFDMRQPQGVWRCDLAHPYERAVANVLVELAWAQDSQNWGPATSLDGAPFVLNEPEIGVAWTRCGCPQPAASIARAPPVRVRVEIMGLIVPRTD
jgi:hypothetical protein